MAKILVLVEGAKTDVRLIKHLLSVYEIDSKYEVVSYNTNIYTLYKEMFYDGKPQEKDTLQVLKQHEQDKEKKLIFEQEYTDILLVFDVDTQDNLFTSDKIFTMMNYFIESTDMGRLYLNYPMVEAFYHMSSIPDHAYNDRIVTMNELLEDTYKTRVNRENRNRDYSKFAVTREECNTVIKQNINKGNCIINAGLENTLPDTSLILNVQLKMLDELQKMYVLCTCVFFIPEYSRHLLK